MLCFTHHIAVVHCIVFFSYKKIHCIIVRGACFSPAAVECLSQYLRVTKNNMIMGKHTSGLSAKDMLVIVINHLYCAICPGVPDTTFPFPFAKLNGVRLAVHAPDPVVVDKSLKHLRYLLSTSFCDESTQC